MILNVDFALKLSNYTSLKRYMSQMNPKKIFYNTMNTQFNHYTLPATPFKALVLKLYLQNPDRILRQLVNTLELIV